MINSSSPRKLGTLMGLSELYLKLAHLMSQVQYRKEWMDSIILNPRPKPSLRQAAKESNLIILGVNNLYSPRLFSILPFRYQNQPVVLQIICHPSHQVL
jgi:hypothetical protein